MLTYSNYMAQKIELDEEMYETKRKESDRVKEIEEERQVSNSHLFEQYLDKKKQNNQEYADKIRDARKEYIAQRRDIYERQTILTAEWRGQLTKLENGEITREQIYDSAPPSSGEQHKEGGEG